MGNRLSRGPSSDPSDLHPIPGANDLILAPLLIKVSQNLSSGRRIFDKLIRAIQTVQRVTHRTSKQNFGLAKGEIGQRELLLSLVLTQT
jgi:hypothetical protein